MTENNPKICGEKINIPLYLIDSDDITYRLTTKTETQELRVSIQTVGLINPPILIEKQAAYKIICGFRRIAACRQLGWKKIPAYLADAKTHELQLASLAISDNSLQRQLNLIEISKAFSMLASFLNNIDEILEIAKALGLPANKSYIQKVKPLCNLPEYLQACILNDVISLPIALELGAIDKAGIELAKIFDALKPGLNRQREIIALIREIACRDNRLITDILFENAFQNILNADIDRNQKLMRIREYLNFRRFPAITSAKQAFYDRLKELKIDKTARLIPPENFEGTSYTLNLSFTTLTDLINHRKTLDKIIEHPAMTEILERK